MDLNSERVKVVETQHVTDHSLETIINEMLLEGWILDGIHFAMRSSSRRPSMAFLIFTQSTALPVTDPPTSEQ